MNEFNLILYSIIYHELSCPNNKRLHVNNSINFLKIYSITFVVKNIKRILFLQLSKWCEDFWE